MTSLQTIPAPEWDVAEWIGTPSPLTSLRGRVVLVEAFQMLCAGCVNYGIPQAQKVQRMFPDVTVVGLHTVFEHHDVTGADALKVFLHEFGVHFPVGIDRHDDAAIPVTMRTYGLEGTPTTLLFDRAGTLRLKHLGKVDDLALGVLIGQLLAETTPADGGSASGTADGSASGTASGTADGSANASAGAAVDDPPPTDGTAPDDGVPGAHDPSADS